MNNYHLIYHHKAYEPNNTVLPKFTKEELDIAEKNTNGFIWTVKNNNGMLIDYYLTKLLWLKK